MVTFEKHNTKAWSGESFEALVLLNFTMVNYIYYRALSDSISVEIRSRKVVKFAVGPSKAYLHAVTWCALATMNRKGRG